VPYARLIRVAEVLAFLLFGVQVTLTDARDLYNRADNEAKPELSIERQVFAMAYMRLAEMADRNVLLDPKEDIDEP
jgi:hypothetical protein